MAEKRKYAEELNPTTSPTLRSAQTESQSEDSEAEEQQVLDKSVASELSPTSPTTPSCRVSRMEAKEVDSCQQMASNWIQQLILKLHFLTFRIQKQIIRLSSLQKPTLINSDYLIDGPPNLSSKIISLKKTLYIQYRELEYLRAALRLNSSAYSSKYNPNVCPIQTDVDIMGSNRCLNGAQVIDESNITHQLDQSLMATLATPPATPQSKGSSSSLSPHDNECLIGHQTDSDMFYTNCYHNSN
ncbi:unnamed protein product [Oppiella nova]|uniref:Uncharacterized protein n=1 Tax=Oppiella nova TaxID=334625 RepID=A0A7R9LG66_9ACAR|nr:unnamed protein product [Oppiella nova]CAG2163239.1 unnamed protein product [Oppiella nova]